MSAIELRGAPVAQAINEKIMADVAELRDRGITPCLVSVQVGEDDASRIYRNQQEKKATAAGIKYERLDLPADTTQDQLAARLIDLNEDNGVSGIILMTPLPKGMNLNAMQGLIAPSKDVDGVTAANLGAAMAGRPGLYPSTALSAFELILSTGVDLKGKETVVVGRSVIVSRPVFMMLIERRATATMCHTGTQAAGKFEYHIRRAEILVVATGQPALVPGEWVREGSIVIDVGINYVGEKIVGDVEYAPAAERAAYITPVPGGVGPLTVTMLLRNTVTAARLLSDK